MESRGMNMLPRAGLSIEGAMPYTIAGMPDGVVRHCPECEGMTMKGLLCVVPALLAVNAASGEDVFLSSPAYDITVTLEYTDPADPYGDQGYIETYKSVSYFSEVRFGPSISPAFAASFFADGSLTGSGGTMPSMQKQGAGAIEYVTFQPAWESDDEEVGAILTHGPEPFTPTLTIINAAMAADMADPDAGADMPTVPIEPTVWLLFNEGISLTDPELRWLYPGMGETSLGGGMTAFSVPRDALAEGDEMYIDVPFSAPENATGTWTIHFEPSE